MKKSIASAIMHIYPQLQPFVDFHVTEENDVQVIASWNNSNPQPTSDQLDAAWFGVLKNIKKSELNESCNQAIANGFSSSALGTAHTYPSHDKAQSNFNTEMNRFLLDSTYTTCKFFTEDAGWLDHTKDQLVQVFKDGHNYGNAQWQKLFDLFAKVDALTYPTNTESDIDAITW